MDSFPDPNQRAVIDQLHGALLVLAPAGSGKTRVMTERLARVVQDGIDPRDTLCVTFTNRAASEMRERIAGRLGRAARDARIMTFHALCAWILRLEAREAGYPQDYLVYDEVDCIEALRSLGLREPDAKTAFHEIGAAKSRARADDLTLGRISDRLFRTVDAKLARDYHRLLADQHAADFADLVYRVRSIFHMRPDAAALWRGRFAWLQIDEVQDTHLSEFDVIRTIAHGCSGIALYGDLDQTIYEWRGSDPSHVLEAFEAAFGPIRCHDLEFNYRATRSLVCLAERFKASFDNAATRLAPAKSLPQGPPPVVLSGEDAEDEAMAIARDLAARRRDGERIGVLAPTNRVAGIVSAAFTECDIEHVTVEQFEFFRRQEIKDALARMRLLLNPRDEFAAQRVLQRPNRGIGDATVREIRDAGRDAHMRLSDLLSLDTHVDGEPYAALLSAWSDGSLVVLDVESTGLDTSRDEVIEIAAVRRHGDGTVEEFHRFIRPTLPVGPSELVHGYSDEYLAEHGEPSAVVLDALRAFVANAVVVAHNAGYDIDILRSQARRTDASLEFRRVVDTYDVATRLWRYERYTLEALCDELDTAHRPTHRAMDDVRATLDLLSVQVQALREGAATRDAVVRKHGGKFRPLAETFETWRGLARAERPSFLVRTILEGDDLLGHYAQEPRRVEHLSEFVEFLEARDDPAEAPWDALGRLSRTVALARNVDHLAEEDPRIPIITIHQAKGLEFDGVYVAGAVESGIPSYFAIRDDTIEEQRRLFYVALTRPKRWICLSWSRVNAYGYPSKPSRFLEDAGLRP